MAAEGGGVEAAGARAAAGAMVWAREGVAGWALAWEAAWERAVEGGSAEAAGGRAAGGWAMGAWGAAAGGAWERGAAVVAACKRSDSTGRML